MTMHMTDRVAALVVLVLVTLAPALIVGPLGQPAGVRIEVVEHQDDPLGLGVAPVQERADLHRPVDLGAPRGGGDPGASRLRLGEQEEIRGPGALILIIDPPGAPRGGRHRTRVSLTNLTGRSSMHTSDAVGLGCC